VHRASAVEAAQVEDRMSGLATRTGGTLFLILAAACSSGDEGPKTPLAALAADSGAAPAAEQDILTPAAQAAVDSGNVLFRARRYPQALSRYRAAAVLAPQSPTPLFGIYMVAQATANTRLLDSAVAELRRLNGPLPDAIHGAPDDSAARPPHPPIPAKRAGS
jgi:hypothetical protein